MVQVGVFEGTPGQAIPQNPPAGVRTLRGEAGWTGRLADAVTAWLSPLSWGSAMPQSRAQPETTSAWSPLRQSLFRSLWIASVASNIGTWMHDVGGVWLMTSLVPSPIMVALMQTATSLPFFLLALPAGALADVVDRRRLLLAMQEWMMAAAAVLGTLTLTGVTTPWSLLALTFALGLGAAMNAPA